MELSKIPEYLEYMDNFVRGKWLSAAGCVNQILNKYDLSPDQRSFLLMRLGDIEFQAGRKQEALRIYQFGESASPTSYYAKYRVCVFIFQCMDGYEGALSKCDQCISELKGGNFTVVADDFSKQQYLEMFDELRSDIVNTMRSTARGGK
jgi:tetratricopeptide (TPR) repeat protein